MARIHIFNGFQNPFGGSEREALELAAELGAESEVRLWATTSRASPELMARHPIRRLHATAREMPDGGTYVFVGAHWAKGLWPYRARRPERLIYVYNTFHPKLTRLTSRPRPLLGWPAAEYVFISRYQRERLGLEGVVHPSPIAIADFAARREVHDGPLVIGRLSRDTPDKFHADDPAVFAALAAEGHMVRLQGATCLKAAYPGDWTAAPGIALAGEGAVPAPDFLRGLDLFYYRTGAHIETFGRVVAEAMASGLPVVAGLPGGYADFIRHGENGFLVSTTEEARACLSALIADPALRLRIGTEARRTMEALYAPQARAERLAFYRAPRRPEEPRAR